MTCEPWPVSPLCDLSEVDDTVAEEATNVASELLWALSGRRFGNCSVTELYTTSCGNECGMPYKDANGNWYNGVVGTHECCSIRLDRLHVREVTEVRLDDTVLDPASYVLLGGLLRRIGACWPCELYCTEPRIAVTYGYGAPIPLVAELAMCEMVTELVSGMTGGTCKLPSRAVSITRQGVSVEMTGTLDLLNAGWQGMPLTDQFIKLTNPGHMVQRSRVYSPDMAKVVR